MRSKLIVLACVVLVAGIFGTYGQAQEAPLDLGETNLLLLACDYAIERAEEEGLEVRYCRRDSEEIAGYEARVVVKISVKQVGRFLVGVSFQKSLWSVQDWDVESA